MKIKKSIVFAAFTAILLASNFLDYSHAEMGGSASLVLTKEQEESYQNTNNLQKNLSKLGEELEKKAGAVEMGMSTSDYEKFLLSNDSKKIEKVKELAKSLRYQVIYQSRIEASNSDLNLYIDDYTNESLAKYASVCFSPIDYHNLSRERAVIIVSNGYRREINKLNKKLNIDESYDLETVPEKVEIEYNYEDKYEIKEEDKLIELDDIKLDEENFPDYNFRNYIKENFDKNNNSILEKEELLKIRKIDLSIDSSIDLSEIKTVKGIEKLIFLEVLNCSYVEISDIDISNNKNLYDLDLSGTQVSNIDVSKNIKLSRLNLSNTKVSEIDISNNKNLWFLELSGTQISNIDVSKNTELEHLYIFNTKLSKLDVTHNPKLLRLSLSNTNISEIDTSKNPELFAFDIEETKVSRVDISNNKKLYEIYMTNTPIEEVDVRNNPRLGHIRLEGTNVKKVDVSKNPNLVCLTLGNTDIRKVDLSNNHDIIEVLASGSSLEEIKLPLRTGIKVLECSGTNLEEINLQGNPYLVGLDISDTKIKKIDVKKAKGLSRLEIANTPIKELDISNNHNLRKLNINNTKIKGLENLDLTTLTNDTLNELNCYNAGIKSMKLPENMSQLNTLNISNNSIPYVYLGNVPNLWNGKSISTQKIKLKGKLLNKKIRVDMNNIVDDVNKVEIEGLDNYTYKGGILEFKEINGKRDFTYNYLTSSKDNDLAKMKVSVSVDIEASATSSSSKHNTNSYNNHINDDNEIKIVKNSFEKNSRKIIKERINENNSRVSGKNRFSTAVEVSKLIYKKSDTAILVNSKKTSDVLTSSTLSDFINSPVLYVEENNLPEETIKELERLGSKNIIIIGGEKSVSRQIENRLSKDYKNQRIAGENRFNTANSIAKIIHKNNNSKKAIIVSANSYSDALAISSLAAKDKIPVLISDGEVLSKETEEFIKLQGIKEVTYAGGKSSISDKVINQVEKLGTKTAIRYAGKDRYETSANILLGVRPNSRYAICVNGENISDAIIANLIATDLESSIILIKNNEIPICVDSLIRNIESANRIVVGGEKTISNEVLKILKK
ncbi:cell wall-binding repeat-containing protein [Peptostreptococcus russellii]|uniref:cell wall-binding repeat-containing protein n=1 Tax=Peptostreptococcus russellii TaxID=215200 RepID=UPI003F580857